MRRSLVELTSGCLSRMQGNLHVRFLGEAAAATPWPYPLTRLPLILRGAMCPESQGATPSAPLAGTLMI